MRLRVSRVGSRAPMEQKRPQQPERATVDCDEDEDHDDHRHRRLVNSSRSHRTCQARWCSGYMRVLVAGWPIVLRIVLQRPRIKQYWDSRDRIIVFILNIYMCPIL